MDADTNIHIRQTGIIDPVKLTHRIAIIGAGSIGGWTALCLGKLGCKDITVMDYDTVEIHNAGSQIYKAADEHMSKVDALQERLRFLLENPIKTVFTKWTPEIDLTQYDIVIAATDNITVRQEIFEYLVKKGVDAPRLYLDARMASNAIEIYITYPHLPESCKQYQQTLFAEEDTLPIPCSERSVVYNVFCVASMLGDLIAKYANDQELPQEIIIDLFNFTMFKS